MNKKAASHLAASVVVAVFNAMATAPFISSGIAVKIVGQRLFGRKSFPNNPASASGLNYGSRKTSPYTNWRIVPAIVSQKYAELFSIGSSNLCHNVKGLTATRILFSTAPIFIRTAAS